MIAELLRPLPRIYAEPRRLWEPRAATSAIVGATRVGQHAVTPPASTLSPGAGWPGATSDPAQQGSGPYSTRPPCGYKCITPPYFDLKTRTTVRFITDHLSTAGIEKVAVAVDGGSWVDIVNPTMQPFAVATELNAILGGYPTYDIDLDPDLFPGPKLYELRFISYPVNGQPKVGDSLYFFGGTSDYFADDPVYEMTIGVDNIFDLIDAIAADNLSNGRLQNADGGTIKILGGTGSLGVYSGGGTHHNIPIPYTPKRRLNIVLGDGLTPGATGIVNQFSRIAIPLINYERIKFVPIADGLLAGTVGDRFQMAGCIVNSGDRMATSSLVASNLTMLSRTDTAWGSTESASGYAPLIIRDNVNGLSNDCWITECLVDSRARRVSAFEEDDVTYSGRHVDVLSWDDSVTNTMYWGVVATDEIAGQGWETHAGNKTNMSIRGMLIDNSWGEIAPRSLGSRCVVMPDFWMNIKIEAMRSSGTDMVSGGGHDFILDGGVFVDSFCGGSPVTDSAAQNPNDARDAGWEVRVS